jgi:hypothetical protein
MIEDFDYVSAPNYSEKGNPQIGLINKYNK